MAQTTTQVGNVNITTHVVPGTNTVDSALPNSVKNFIPISKHFKKTPVKALSSVLMLTGITQLSFGFVMYAAERRNPSLLVCSGVLFWAGLVVFTAGCVSLTALLRDTVHMIKACMVCNIVNISVGVIGVTLYAVQIYNESQTCWISTHNVDLSLCWDDFPDSTRYYYRYYDRKDVQRVRLAVTIVVMLFSLLGVAISAFMTKVSDKALKASGYSLLR